MSGRPFWPGDRRGTALRVARWVLGGLFIYMGLTKALQPVEFLKAVREYGFLENHLALNLVAAGLPWFEVFCGLLLVSGIAVAGAAASLLGLLVAFTTMVFLRGWSIHTQQMIPLCAVRFDCGCGTGDVLICRKMLENGLLMVLSALVMTAAARSRDERRSRAG